MLGAESPESFGWGSIFVCKGVSRLEKAWMEEIAAIPLQCLFITKRRVTKRGQCGTFHKVNLKNLENQRTEATTCQGTSLLCIVLEASSSQLATFQLGLGPLLAFPQSDCIGASGHEVALLLNVRGRGAPRPAWPSDI